MYQPHLIKIYTVQKFGTVQKFRKQKDKQRDADKLDKLKECHEMKLGKHLNSIKFATFKLSCEF